MNANATRTVRLASAAAAFALSLGLVSAVSQSMHVERFGEGAQRVLLEPVTVTATTAVAGVDSAVRAN